MKILAPTNWDPKLLTFCRKLNDKKDTKLQIGEFFGSTKHSVTGNARSSSLAEYNAEQDSVAKYIKKAKNAGFNFNYLINPACLGNQEYAISRKKKIVDYIKWVESTGSSHVTVALPFLVDLIKKYTNLKIVLSCVINVQGFNRIHLLEQEGVDRIVLSTNLNRNFLYLKNVAETTNLKLELLANESCLLDCPYRAYHYLVSSHDSQINSQKSSFDYCLIKCSLARLKDFSQIIKAPWVRPEDTNEYSKFNIDFIKLSGRTMNTEWIMRCIEAYAKQKYDGNLYDLIDQQGAYSKEFGSFVKDQNFGKLSIFVDNKKLDGFLQNIQKLKVTCNQDCWKCSICKSVAKKTVHINTASRKKHIKNLKTVLEKGITC